MTTNRHPSHRTSGISQEVDESYWLFRPGQRVMTVDGISGVVTEVQDGPFAGNEQYLVTLDGNMGGGAYESSDLTEIPGTTAAITPQQEFANKVAQTYEDLGGEQLGRYIASEDYPELAEILVERPPLSHAEPLVMRASKVEASQGDWGIDPNDFWCEACGFHGNVPPVTDLATGRLMDVCPSCHASEPNVPLDVDGWPVAASVDKNISPESAADEQVFFATAGLFDRVLGPVTDVLNSQMKPEWQYKPGNNYSVDWCRFRKNERCMFPKQYDVEGTLEAGYAVWVPEDRGRCPRQTFETQKACTVAEPGPNSGDPNAKVDATVAWKDGGQHGGQPVHASAAGFEFTASWSDVRNKARKIRSEGGVRIVSSPGDNKDVLTLTAEVNGDEHTYETTLLREPGKQNVASWRCGCAWASYSWGRSGQYKRFEGRMCSHALALQYEAQSRGMFGRTIVEDAATPPWRVGRDPFEYVKPNRQQSLPVAASLSGQFRPVYEDGIFEPSPLTYIAATGGLSTTASQTPVLDFGGRLKALVNGVVHRIMHVTDRDAVTDSGAMVPVNTLLYPTYSPTKGLTLTVNASRDSQDQPYGGLSVESVIDPVAQHVQHLDAFAFEGGDNYAVADLHPEPEPALPSTDGAEDEGLDKTAASIGFTPDADAEKVADELLIWAGQHDALVTNAVRTSADEVDGEIDPNSLPFRIKGRKRMVDKIKADVIQKHPITPAQVGMRFADSLRFTVLFSLQNYAFQSQAFLDTMAVRGFRPDTPDRVKNYWLRDDPYDGINAVLRCPDGFPFEVQFHTDQSMNLKDDIHKLFEEYRGDYGPVKPERRKFLWDEMIARANTVERATWESDVGRHEQHHFQSGLGKNFYYAFQGDLPGEYRGVFRRVEEPGDVRFERYSIPDGKWVEDNTLAGHLVKGATDVEPIDDLTAQIIVNTSKKTGSTQASMDTTLSPGYEEALVVEALVDPETAPEMAEVVAASLVDNPPTVGDPRLAWLADSGSPSGEASENGDIAAAAKAFLAKEALKSFTPAEQAAIISEGADVLAGNLGDLDIRGTHYEGLEAALAAAEEEDGLT